MMTQIKYAVCTAGAFVFLSGCNGVRDRDCSPMVNLEVKFAINLEMEPYNTKAHQAGEAKPDKGRYVVEIFELGSRMPLKRLVSAKQSIVHGENSISAIFQLTPAKYTIAAWVDYLEEGDNFYDVTDLSAIKINPDYHGSNDLDNAFVGIAEIDLTPEAAKGNSNVVKIVEMECPFAKIRIIATDAEKLKASDLSTFTTQFTYPGFLPTSFNIVQNNPNDVSMGVIFTSDAMLLEKQECLLGYDYVFVNGNESGILLDLIIHGGNGEVINSVSGISIPVARGKVTTIKGGFFTGGDKTGVAIDPAFEGEINIELD